MRLYRIMLVDDEAEVRESIIRKIDWESAGFQMVGDAENGVDALEKVELFEPDIVLTDILMPYMDGLELASRIHLMYPSIKLVIFSGFDEFEYAKQAMQSGVIEYILKPVNVDELTRILHKIKQTLDDELRRRRNVEALRESFLKNLPILRERMLYDLTHGGVTEPVKIPALMREYGLDIAEAESWVVAQLVIDRPPEETDAGFPFSGESELIPISVLRIFEDMLGKHTKFAAFRSSMGICVVAAVSAPVTLDSVIAVLSDACRECKRALELNVTVGIGQTVDKLSELASSYREASEAAGFKVVHGTGPVIYIGDVERSYKPMSAIDKKSENELIAAIKFGGSAEIVAAARKVISDVESARPHLTQLQFYTVSIMNSLLQLAGSYELDLSDIFGPQTDFWTSLSQLKGAESLYNWLLEISSKLGEMIHEGRSNIAKSVVEEAKDLIAANYTNADLSLESVCGELHISAAYFSTVFKRETGQSYINYLTGLRLEKAVELLTHTGDKTYLIAEKAGYSDPNYFSYVFKKRYGVSPTKYRSSITRE